MKTLIFDYDDTLAWNQHYYSYAQADLIKLILDRLGPRTPNAPAILNREVELDMELVKTNGFGIERFPTSFKQVYEEISKKLGLDDSEGAQQAYNIGMSVFDSEKWSLEGLVDGAEETLDFLNDKKDELILFTAGDYNVQSGKIQATGVKRWFEGKIYIVQRKNEAAFAEVISLRDKKDIWMIGNSMRSDILPALKIGIGAIYLPQDTWAYESEHEMAPKDSSRLTTLKEISDIKKQYETLFAPSIL